MTTIRNINDIPDPGVIEALREALAMAEAGELRSVAIVGGLIGNRTLTSFETNDTQMLIGMLAFLQHTICARKRENAQ